MGRKDETYPLAMRALSLETIVWYRREYALAYSDGSSTGCTGNGGYGSYFLWPDGNTTRICGPVGETTCSYECELMVVTECLRVVIEKQREAARSSRAAGRGHLYQLQSLGESFGGGGAVSGLPSEDRGRADRGSVASVSR
ncbi:hypothetical protein PoB_003091900 [Plakobranchus ocellatus]|uniref:Uncharacterized protein n=1 Tax=Plakobranchus ocellatus TaxID=259542 RepID=A0AAV4A9R0_9GAST|nr:hypothetical protein PoB_003091900 [Plakobranchus ocellatus]